MAISIISGFDVNKSEPTDVRETVANITARLALSYPYKGLAVREADTGQIYRYITTTPVDGGLPSNIAGDWELVPTVFTGTGAPATGKGVIGDIWIDETGFIVYKKTGVATWTALFSISGAHILTGAVVPTTEGVNGDMYVRSNGEVYTKAGGIWTLQFDISGTDGLSDTYATTSTTSINLGTAVAPLSVTVDQGLSYTVGQSVIIASRANNNNNITGDVVSYTTGTGVLIIDNLTIGGAGTFTDWDVNLSGSPGKQGKGFIHTEVNITLDAAKIASVEAGSWTPQNPWGAAVGNDLRVSLGTPAELSGNMTGNSISWDGVRWWNNGRWLGFTGAQGIQGPQGPPGIQGPPGLASFPKAVGRNRLNALLGEQATTPYVVTYASFNVGTGYTSTLEVIQLPINYPIYRPHIKFSFDVKANGGDNRIVELKIYRNPGGVLLKTVTRLVDNSSWRGVDIEVIDTAWNGDPSISYFATCFAKSGGASWIAHNYDFIILPCVYAV